MLIEEAGGIISDSLGGPLNFGLGRTLGGNDGKVVAMREVRSKMLSDQKVREEAAAQAATS